MKGSVYHKKSNGKYYPILYLGKDELTGRKIRKWGSGHIKEKDAETELRKLLNDYDNDDIETGKVTFQYVYDIWSETVAPEQYRSDKNLDTAKSYAEVHILPIWGKKNLSSIEPQQLQKFFVDLCTGKTKTLKKQEQIKLAPQTKKKILSIMRSVFNLAVEYHFLKKSPAKNIVIKDGGGKEFQTWKAAELTYFLNLEEVKESPYYNPIILGLTSGMRRGEICGLQWKDYNGTSLFVRRAMDTNGSFTKMKTKSSHRRIELMDETIAALETQKEKQKAWSKIDGYIKSDFICTREDGSIIRPIPVSVNFKKLTTLNNDRAKEKENKEREKPYIELPVIRFHDLRHTFATISLENDINTKIVSEILGHTDTRTTQMIYQSVTPTMQRSAVKQLGRAYFGIEKGIESNQKALQS
jgi:integrase